MNVRIYLLLASAACLCASQASGQQPAYDPGAPVTQPQPAYGQPPQTGVAETAVPPDVTPQAGAALPAAAAVAGPPAPPNLPALTEAELQYVMQTLRAWETESAKIETYHADFERLEYDQVWGPGGNQPNIICLGSISYSKPDKGSFKVDEIRRWTKTDPQNPAPDAPGDYVEQKDEVGEHWVCDGKAIYEYNHRDKQLVVTPIPDEMRGVAIVDGPLPFLFGAQADKLIERYWIYPTRPPEGVVGQVWLKAFPRRQADAANYDFVEIILNAATMQPMALQIHLPGGQQRHVYKFSDAKVNGTLDNWFGGLFSAPRTPLGWKRVVVQPESTEVVPGPQASNPADGVQR
jgi:TIGR03009 family protein